MEKKKHINSSVLSFLHSPILTSIHDHWKYHSLDQMDLCWQSNVSMFYCSHEIKRRLLLGRKVMTNIDSILKS